MHEETHFFGVPSQDSDVSFIRDVNGTTVCIRVCLISSQSLLTSWRVGLYFMQDEGKNTIKKENQTIILFLK